MNTNPSTSPVAAALPPINPSKVSALRSEVASGRIQFPNGDYNYREVMAAGILRWRVGRNGITTVIAFA